MTDAPSPGSFVRKSGVPRLDTALVLFLDLLGTSVAADSGKAQDTLEALDMALNRARARSMLDDDWSWSNSSWFSDNLIVAANLHTSGEHIEAVVAGVIVSAAWLQFLLTIDGFFGRGGMVVGEHFMDERITFGPALVEAVDLEKATKQPRVELADSAVALVHLVSQPWGRNSTSNPFEEHLAVDQNNTVFVNYLRIVVGEANDDAEADMMIAEHRRAIDAQLAEPHPETVMQKYRWTAGYHNWLCDLYGRPDLMVEGQPVAQMAPFVAEPPPRRRNRTTVDATPMPADSDTPGGG